MRTEHQQAQIDKMEYGLTNQAPTGEQLDRISSIRVAGKILGRCIIDETEPSRDQSLALTALEDCVMRAVRAVVLEGGPV